VSDETTPEDVFSVRRAIAAGENVYIERRPVPDPSNLTQSAIDRAVSAMLTLVDEKIDGAKRTIQAIIEGHWALDETRFANIKRELELAISRRTELDAERFGAVSLRFNERDLRFAQQNADHQASISAALASANAATQRLETTFSKQIEALGARLDAQAIAQAERITDLKDRISGVEGERKGATTSTTLVIGIVGSMLVLAGLVITHVFTNAPASLTIH
jgi:hypothetical protein